MNNYTTPYIATVFLLLLSVLIFSGCVTVGKKFPTDAAPDLQIGQTTKAEVLQRLGPPWRTGLENGDERWTYAYYYYPLIGKNVTYDLVIRFDTDGYVSAYSFNTNEAPNSGSE